MLHSCRHHQQGLNLLDVSLVLQAVGAADAEGAIPSAQPAREALKAVANPGSNQASPLINRPTQVPHHASPVPAEPATNRQGRRRTRRSAEPELLGQTRGNASLSPAPVDASHDGPVTARQSRSGGFTPAEYPLPVQQASRHKRKSGAAADVERAKKVMAEQRRAGPSSHAVVPAAAGQGLKAGQGGADQKDRQGRADQKDKQSRAAPGSPALSSPGGTNFHSHSIT